MSKPPFRPIGPSAQPSLTVSAATRPAAASPSPVAACPQGAGGAACAPISNTGAQITYCEATNHSADLDADGMLKTRALIDYLSVNFKGADALSVAKCLFGSEEWTELDKGGYGYTKSMRRGSLAIYYGGNVHPGQVYVSAPGSACRELEATGRIQYSGPDRDLFGLPLWSAWQAFFADILESGGTFTRLDVALDDYAGNLSLSLMEEHLRNKDVATRFKTVRIDRSFSLMREEGKPEPPEGLTIYLGSPASDTLLRIYDKRAEQYLKVEDPSTLPAHWVRCELQVRDDRAQALASAVHQYGVDGAIQVIFSYLDFKEKRGGDSNITRRPSARWWRDFLDVANRLRLATAPKVATLEKMEKWIHKQVLPSLNVLFESPQHGPGWLKAQIVGAACRLRPKHIALLLQAYGQEVTT